MKESLNELLRIYFVTMIKNWVLMHMKDHIGKAYARLLYDEFRQILRQHELYYILHIDNQLKTFLI